MEPIWPALSALYPNSRMHGWNQLSGLESMKEWAKSSPDFSPAQHRFVCRPALLLWLPYEPHAGVGCAGPRRP